MNRKTILRVAIGTVVLVGALWFVVSKVDLGQMLRIVSEASPVPLLLSIPVILASHVMRARRWKTLLAPRVPNVQVSHAFSAIMIGYAANTIVPRVGEILRPWVFARRSRIPMGTALSSVIVERVLDVLTLLLGIAIVATIERDHLTQAIPSFTTARLVTTIILPVVVIIVVLAIIAFTSAGTWFITTVITRIHPAFGAAVRRMHDSIHEGVAVIRTPASWVRLVIESALIWGLYILPLWLTMKAMPLSGSVTFSIADAAVLLVIISIGVTIAPTPGALGVYQGFAQTALVNIYHTTAGEGLAFGILAWVVNYGISLVVGGMCWIIELRNGLTWRDVRGTVTTSSS